jgi:hypothetical protein
MAKNLRFTIENRLRHFDAVIEHPNHHHYIQFSESARAGAVTESSFMVVDHFLKNIQNRNKWRRDHREYTVSQTDDKGYTVTSAPFNYLKIAQSIREQGSFNTEAFGLLPMECQWMDFTLDMSLNAQFKGPEDNADVLKILDGTPQQFYGHNYPIKPALDREGRSFSTMQPLMLKRIIRTRNKLIGNSDQSLTPDWFLDLRTLISDVVSIVEITLNQIYIKAEFDPLPGWTFNKENLGERHGRRFDDKLKWIYKISGKHLGAEKHLPAVNRLRELRNHLMHFDPPSFTLTLEEATGWLNDMIDVGYLLIAIRRALDLPLSNDLVNFILQRDAVFVPEQDFNGRNPVPTDGSAGYSSSVWPQ